MTLGYVLQSTDHQKYVARPGTSRSYTHQLDDAQVFLDRRDAEANRCENERVVSLFDLFFRRVT